MRALAVATLLALSPLAQAIECGATVSGDLRLDRDLVCAGDRPALTVTGRGARIDLNGFSLRGDGRGTGILVQDAAGVVLQGEGRIEGFATGVEGLRAPRLAVRDLAFAGLDSGVLLHNSAAAEVSGNRFEAITAHAVSAKALPYAEFLGESGEHRLVDNTIQGAGFGLHLCGWDSGGSLIEGNRLSDIGQIGLLIEDGADDNRIQGNQIERSGVVAIALRGSSENAIRDNQLLGGRVGISLVPESGPGCVSRGMAEVAGNRIEDNLIADHNRPFAFGQTRPRGPIGPNRLRGNVIADAGEPLAAVERYPAR